MKGIPEIRFNKYSEKWESLNAGTLFYPVTDKGYPELPVLSASQEEGMIPRKDIGINMSYSRKNVGGYKRVLPGDFVVHLRSFQGGFAHSASEGITSPAYTVLRLNKERNQDDNFWKHYMTSMNFIDSLRIVTYGIRDGRNINVSEFLDTNLIFPKDKQEQTAIGKFFDDLDEYISSQALELQKLKNIKKACLEKMFPKEGELVPEIRFNGFEGNWERTTLNNFLETKVEKNENDKYNKYDIFSVSGEYGVVNQIEFQGKSFAGASLKGYKVTHLGQVIYTKSPLKAQPYGIIKTNNATDGIVSTLYAVYEPKGEVDTSFIQYYFELDGRLNNYLRPLVNKGAKNTLLISDDDALKGYVTFPKDVTEQKEITKYFLCLDNFIYNAVKKLDKLKQIRKGLLEKMFVANN